MGKSYSTIRFEAKACDGCGKCMTACAQAKAGVDDLARSRIHIVADPAGKGWEVAMCRQCGDPKCVMTCPSGALTKSISSGVIDWAVDKCVDCLLCTVGCAFGGIAWDHAESHVAKCDKCEGGEPACAQACPTGAIEVLYANRLHAEVADKEDLFVPGLSACQGCNSELLIRHTLRDVGRNTVVAAPPGCIPGMGTVGYNGVTGCKVPIFHPLLTNTASMLAGLKRHYNRQGRDVTMLALAGDGGTGDVGFQSLSGAAERGEQMLFVCVDNEGYMNTGMQSSGATSFGSWTSTTPVGPALQGKRTDSKNLAVVMMMHNCEYVATAATAFMDDYYVKLRKALDASKRGFAYLHVYAPCPSGWRFPSSMTTEVCRLQVETNFSPLWDYTPTQGLAFTRSVDKPKPLAQYLDAIGKYRHLSPEQVAHIQRNLDTKVAFLRRFAGTGQREAV